MTADVSVRVGGKLLTGWKAVDVVKSMTSLCGSFSLTQSANKDDAFPAYLPIFPGDRVEILLAGSPFFTAWVDGISPKVSENSHEIGVAGREVTCDLVDCSLLNSSGSWKNVTLRQLIGILGAPFGLEYSPDGGANPGDPFPVFSAEPGDSVFTTLQKAASLRGVLLTTTRDGRVGLIQEGTGRSSDRLVYGVNVRTASGNFDVKDRFSSYTVRGTSSPTPGGSYFAEAKKMHVQAGATDLGVGRYRPLVLVGGNDMGHTSAATRAAWEATTRAAKSGALEVSVHGWAQTDGTLWECARLVSVELPPILGPGSQDFLISQVRYSLNGSGTSATLSLVHPGAFKSLDKDKRAKKPPADPWASVRKAVRG